MRKFRTKKNLISGLLVLCAIAFIITYAYAALKTETNRVTYTDLQKFRGQVEFMNKMTFGSGVYTIQNPVIVSLSGTSYYTIDPKKGSYYWINDHLSTLGTRIASGVSIILPSITVDLDKYVIRIQKMPFVSGVSNYDAGSSVTKIVITTKPWAGTSGTTDGIWNVTSGATRQSSSLIMPEVSEMDAFGDWLEFTAVYNATSGSSWYQTGRYIQ